MVLFPISNIITIIFATTKYYGM